MGKRENTAIVVNGLKEGKTDDAILQELFEGGIAFGDLRTVFNDIISEKGLRLNSKERKAKTDEIMAETTEVATVEDMQKIVVKLAKELKVADTKAMGSLRTWAKAKGIELPKAPRAAKTRKAGFGGHVKAILDFMLDNRDADKDAVKAFCHANGIPEAYSTQGMNTVHFAKVWSGEIEAEVEAPAEAK